MPLIVATTFAMQPVYNATRAAHARTLGPIYTIQDPLKFMFHTASFAELLHSDIKTYISDNKILRA